MTNNLIKCFILPFSFSKTLIMCPFFGKLFLDETSQTVRTYYKSWWNPEPMLHLFPHWNWPEKQGQEIMVRAYTNCAEVELILKVVPNGLSDVGFSLSSSTCVSGTFPSPSGTCPSSSAAGP